MTRFHFGDIVIVGDKLLIGVVVQTYDDDSYDVYVRKFDEIHRYGDGPGQIIMRAVWGDDKEPCATEVGKFDRVAYQREYMRKRRKK